MATLIIKTNVAQGTDVLIRDMGIIIPNSGGSETFTDNVNIEDARASNDLRTLTTDDAHGVGSSTLILNNGNQDIDQDDIGSFLDRALISGSKLYDAVVPDDYALPSEAFAATDGHLSVFVRSGIYVEGANTVSIPDGGTLIGEEQGVELQFTTGQLIVDGNGGVTETAGTFSVTAGSTAVVGSGTTFTNLISGDYLFIGPDAYEISSITDATNLVLSNPWRGPNRSGLSMFGTSMYSNITINRISISGSTNANGGLCLRGVRNAHIEAVNISDCTHNWQIDDSANFVCEDIYSFNSTNDGLDIATSRSIQFSECHFANNAGHGLEITAGLAFKFNDCEFSVNALNGANVTGSATDVTFDGCGFKQNLLKGLNTDPGTIRAIVDGCTIEFNGSEGIDFDGSQNVIVGCQIGNNGLYGIQAGVEGTITGNRIHDNADNGINLSGDNDCIIVGNIIDGNTNGISFNGTSNRNVVVGNIIFNNTATGVLIASGATDNHVFGNRVFSNTTAQITDNGTTTTFDVRAIGAGRSTLHNFGASAAPTVNNDIDEGYTPGSLWVDTVANTAYICVDNADGAADWNQIDGGTPVLSQVLTAGNTTGGNNISVTSGDAIIGAAELTLQAAAGVMDLDSTGALSVNSSAGAINIGNDAVAQAINIGTGAAARTITIGNATGATSLVLNAGTGNINVGTGAQARTINIGTGAAAQVVTLGSTNTTSSLTLQAGTGTIAMGTSASARTINIGTGAAAQTVTLGSTSGASALTLQAGTAGINLGTSTAAHTINLGTGAAAKTVTLGSTNTTSSLALRAGTGNFTLQANGGQGIIVGSVGGAGTGSAFQARTFTTTERNSNLTAANGMVIYNSTTATLEGRINGAWTDLAGGGSGTAADTARWSVNGKPAVQTNVDGAWIAPRGGTITRVTLYRRSAGGGSSTIVDVNKNGTTIYTTQGNRPTVTAASGNDQIDATTDFDVTTFATDDRFQVDVDQVESGNPQDISIIMEVQYT